jgi:hypothetical protein
MMDLNAIPVRITILSEGALIEVLTRPPLGTVTFCPLRPEQLAALRSDLQADHADGWTEDLAP